jgi:hypothetical protein
LGRSSFLAKQQMVGVLLGASGTPPKLEGGGLNARHQVGSGIPRRGTE